MNPSSIGDVFNLLNRDEHKSGSIVIDDLILAFPPSDRERAVDEFFIAAEPFLGELMTNESRHAMAVAVVEGWRSAGLLSPCKYCDTGRSMALRFVKKCPWCGRGAVKS